MRPKGCVREVLWVDGTIKIAVWLGRPEKTPLGNRRWALRIIPRETQMPSIVCLCSDALDSVEQTYLLPIIDKTKRYKQALTIKEDDPLLQLGIQLKTFNELYPAIYRLLARSDEACAHVDSTSFYFRQVV